VLDDICDAHVIPIGMGIHNESGVKRLSPVPPLDELISHILDPLTSTTDPERSYLPLRGDGTDRVVLMVNNLGGISELELNAVTHAVTSQFENRRVTLVRILVGTFMVRFRTDMLTYRSLHTRRA
jgi:dihydroxyacetone kinase